MGPISASNILYHELIGLSVEVTFSPDASQLGVEGIVVDETASLLILKTLKSIKKIAKGYRTFRFTLSDGRSVKVEGSRLLGRPEERVKRI